jgi:hypothetical protein
MRKAGAEMVWQVTDKKRGLYIQLKPRRQPIRRLGGCFMFSLRVVVPLEGFMNLIKGSESFSVDSYFRGVGVTGVLKKCEKNVKSYFLRETVKQEPVG